jgi:hypothetical protein
MRLHVRGRATHLHMMPPHDKDTTMAHWKKRFPSKYLAVSDLDEPIIATIKLVQDEMVGTGEEAEFKPVVHFHEQIKPCILNQTRADAIADIVGDPDDDTWPGHRIKLRKGWTRFQSKKVTCIVIEAPDASDATQAVGF